MTAYNGGMNEPVGVSILTNNARLEYLKTCVSSFLSNCHYRPLVIGIHDNGSTDGTSKWLDSLPEAYGVEWRISRSEKDSGCAAGTNTSISITRDCEFSLHLESDFRHLTPEESGVDRMWLHRAIEFMRDPERCAYLYLRRMVDEYEMAMHWWDRWMPTVDKEVGSYLRVPHFWWSNNPTLFRTEALFDCGTLPLATHKDGPKGTKDWSRPELEATSPPGAWVYRWGMFVHEHPEPFTEAGCGLVSYGASTCKYGFWKGGDDAWCQACRRNMSYRDMSAHRARFEEWRT